MAVDSVQNQKVNNYVNRLSICDLVARVEVVFVNREVHNYRPQKVHGCGVR